MTVVLEPATVPAPVGRWWAAYAATGEVWPCDVIDRPALWPGHVIIVATHPSAPNYGREMSHPAGQVYDGAFHHPTRTNRLED